MKLVTQVRFVYSYYFIFVHLKLTSVHLQIYRKTSKQISSGDTHCFSLFQEFLINFFFYFSIFFKIGKINNQNFKLNYLVLLKFLYFNFNGRTIVNKHFHQFIYLYDISKLEKSLTTPSFSSSTFIKISGDKILYILEIPFLAFRMLYIIEVSALYSN